MSRTSRIRLLAYGAAAVAALSVTAVGLGLALTEHAGPQEDGTSITPVGWKVTPTGKQIQVGERPYGLALSPDGRSLLVSNDGVSEQSIMLVDAVSGSVEQTLDYPAPEAVFLGVAYSPDGQHAYASAGNNDEIHTYTLSAGSLVEGDSLPLGTTDDAGDPIHPFPAGLTVSPDGQTLYVADQL